MIEEFSPANRQQDLSIALEGTGYVASPALATMLDLSMQLERPLLLEGPAGVGKTSVAMAMAQVLQYDFYRLQCYEGVGASEALYDWNYHLQMAELARNRETDVFSERFLLPRPLLQSIASARGAVLLIDEVDRAEEAFEALLLEFLGEFQITVPEWKTMTAVNKPIVILTSNRTRPLSDALRRRSLYMMLDWPTYEEECQIVQLGVPDLERAVRERMIQAVRTMRTWDLVKVPGIAETLDWTKALVAYGSTIFNLAFAAVTLGCVVKDAADVKEAMRRLPELFSGET